MQTRWNILYSCFQNVSNGHILFHGAVIFRGRVPRHNANSILPGIMFPFLVVVMVAVAVGFNDVVFIVIAGIVEVPLRV